MGVALLWLGERAAERAAVPRARIQMHAALPGMQLI